MYGLLPLLRALSFGYWRRHRMRLALVLASLALGVAAWTATQSLARGVHRAGRRAAAPLGGQADLSVSNDDAGVPRAWAEPFRRVPGVRGVRPLIVRRVRINRPAAASAVLLGLDLTAEVSSQARLSPGAAANMLAAKLRGQNPALAGRGLGIAPGEAEVLIDGKSIQLTVAGTIEEANGPAAALSGHTLVMAADDLARILGKTDCVSRLDLTLEPGAEVERIRHELAMIAGESAQIRTAAELDERSGEMFAGLTAAFSLCGVGALVAGLLLIHNVLAVGVAERRHDAGVLRSLGATRGQLLIAFLAEAAAFGLVGGLIGGPLGLAMGRGGAGPVGKILSDVFLPVDDVAAPFSLTDAVGGLFAGVLTGLLAALAPALKAAAVSPLRALRRLPDQPRRAVAWRSWLPALGFFALGVALHQTGRPWAGLFAFTLAGLAAAPPLTRLLARLIRPAARRFVGVGLAVDNLLRWPARYGLATATLAGGAALLVQTAGVIRSNEAGVRDWLDASVVGDLFVTSGGPLSASGRTLPMDATLANSWPETGTHVVPLRFRHVDWRQGNCSARLLLVLLDARGYREAVVDRYPSLPDRELYCRLSEEPGTAVVSHNFSALHGLKAGDTLTLPALGGSHDFRILGTVADYSCTQGTVLLDRRSAAAFDDGLADVFSVTLPPGTNADAARSEWLRSPQAAVSAPCVLTHAELREHTLGMVRRLYGVAAAQLAVVALVSVLGVAAAMTISVMQRRGELGLLRCIGATRGQIVWAVLAEAVGIGALATAAGLLVGAPLEWFTVRHALPAETGFAFPVHYPGWEALAVALAALGASAAAGLLPALTAARLSPAAVAAGD